MVDHRSKGWSILVACAGLSIALGVLGGVSVRDGSTPPRSALAPALAGPVAVARFDGSVANLVAEPGPAADADGGPPTAKRLGRLMDPVTGEPIGDGDVSGAVEATRAKVAGSDLVPSGPDGYLQGAAGGPTIQAAAPAPLSSFDGMKKEGAAPNGGGWPPDTNGDVGPNHYIQTVNTKVGIYGKTGTQLAMFTFDTLFGGTATPCDASNRGDPVVVYDPLGDRWILSDFAWSNISTGPFYECFAISQTGDPVNGGWYCYPLQAEPRALLPDYPKIGVGSDAIYMSANVFASTGTQPFQNVKVWALNRADLESGIAPRTVSFDIPQIVGGTTVFSLLPVNLRGMAPPAGRPGMFVSIWGTTAARVWQLAADWNNLGASTLTGPSNVPVGSFSVGPTTVPQLSGNSIETLTYRLMMQAQYRNIGGTESLWLSHTVGNGSGVASVRWYQLNVTGGTIQTSGPVQQGTYNPDTNHRFAPSLAVDAAGDMAIGYSVSSSTMRPSIRYAGRLAADPVNTLTLTEQTLIDGTGSQSNT